MQSIFGDIKYKENELMSGHTTFKIGGPAKYFFTPNTDEEIVRIINICRSNNIRYMIMGNGSNMLFGDEGFDGAIIQVYNNYNIIDVHQDGLYAKAGALLSKLAAVARDSSMTGMEFAAGIPGTLGGAVVMNAGAYGGEMKDIIEYVDVLELDGIVKRYTCEGMEFGYRKSIISEDKIVLGAKLKLSKGDKDKIQARMEELKEARMSKQPLELPSAGSTFKRPEGYFATRFPEEYGLESLKNMIAFGGSPRASINLALAAKAYAFIKRRGYVIPEDVRSVAHDVLRHRIGLTYEAEANNMTSEEIISEILNSVEVP